MSLAPMTASSRFAEHTTRARSGGFTLVEMVTSCAILSLLMLSLGYGLKLALISTGDGAAMAASSLEASDLVERVTDDLNEATNFTEKTSQAVTFTVPDRGADGTPDKIRYAWWPTGGNVAAPVAVTIPAFALTRQMNDGGVAVLARDVRQFNLSYLYRTMSPAAAAGVIATDRLLVENNLPAGAGATEPTVNLTKWLGQTFLPSSQPEITVSTSFSITRIALYLRSDGSDYDGLVRISIRTASGTAPSNTILASTDIAEVSLTSSLNWVQFPFTNLTGLSPSTRYSIVVEGREGAPSTANWCAAGRTAGGTMPPNSATFLSINQGGAWTSIPSSSLRYRIYGTTSP